MRPFFLFSTFVALLGGAVAPSLQSQVKPKDTPSTVTTKPPVDATEIEFFEKKIRPILVDHCYRCHSHSANSSQGNLFLDNRSSMMKGGQHGAVLVAGDPDKSLLIDAVRYGHANLQMPPKGKLPDAVIADLATWVKMGAPWHELPNVAKQNISVSDAEKEKKRRLHWAWQPLRKASVPTVKRKTWAQNPIDAFILSKLEAKKLSPVAPADRRTLIRRAYFDLLGLPPSPEEVDAFVSDKSPKAWAKVVETLLANPHYGERWGRFWLDIARYGEDQAHSFEPRLYPQGFRYRDWIVRSLNADMPYNRFIKEQIAADLLGGTDVEEQLPALGFFATGPVYYGDSKMYDQYDDRIDTLTRGVLGLTVACARCHDHKFDPITQKDYYGLAGIFANTAYVEVPLTKDAHQKTELKGDLGEALKKKNEEVDNFIKEHTQSVRERLTHEISKYLVEVWKFTNRQKVKSDLTPAQFATDEKIEKVVLERWIAYLADPKSKAKAPLAEWFKQIQSQDAKTDLSTKETVLADTQKTADAFQAKILSLVSEGEAKGDKAKKPNLEEADRNLLAEVVGDEGVLTVPREQLGEVLTGDPKAHYATISAELARLKTTDFVHALKENASVGNIRVLLRGSTETPGEETPRRFLTILAGDNAPAFKQGSGRLELANAITADTNPLTPRVIVNRIWQHHFGTGIVRTTNNFGLLGEPPTHPELLDYLTSEFVAEGWSLKKLHRKMMLSATYQMSCVTDKKDYEVDPDNRLVWRMPIHRLEVEAWRDAMLTVSGKLDETLGGQSGSLEAPENCRRTFYAAISRHDLDSMLRLFDFPDPNVTSDKRTNTTVPIQQLFVLNSEFMIREAKAFATRLTTNPKEDDASRIRRAFLLAYNRLPSPKEVALGLFFLKTPPNNTPSASATVKTAEVNSPKENKVLLSRWEQYAQILLGANEFMYID